MSTFDYEASAELFAAQGRSGLRYRRFAQAAEAIRYAMEQLPAKVLAGTSLEVDDERFNAEQIHCSTAWSHPLGEADFGIAAALRLPDAI